MGAIWPWFDLLEVIVTYLSLYIFGSLGASQYPQETDYKKPLLYFCAPVYYCNFDISFVSRDLEIDVKVKRLVWDKGNGKVNHLAYSKGRCCQNTLNYKQTLFPLKYIGKVNFSL